MQNALTQAYQVSSEAQNWSVFSVKKSQFET